MAGENGSSTKCYTICGGGARRSDRSWHPTQSKQWSSHSQTDLHRHEGQQQKNSWCFAEHTHGTYGTDGCGTGASAFGLICRASEGSASGRAFPFTLPYSQTVGSLGMERRHQIITRSVSCRGQDDTGRCAAGRRPGTSAASAIGPRGRRRRCPRGVPGWLAESGGSTAAACDVGVTELTARRPPHDATGQRRTQHPTAVPSSVLHGQAPGFVLRGRIHTLLKAAGDFRGGESACFGR